MRAHAIAVLSAFLCVCAAAPADAAPIGPDTVRKQRISDTQVRITWRDRSDDEEGFEVLRRAIDKVDFELRGTVAADELEFVDDAPRDPIFIYQVRAFNGDEDSELSNRCYVNRSPAAVPLNFNVRLIALTVVRVSWSDRSNGERAFEIQRALVGKPFKTIVRAPANTEVYDDYDLAAANSYVYRMRALGRPGICWASSKYTVDRAVTTLGGVRLLQVELRGRGNGTVTSDPPGISCGPHDDHCSANFPLATDVTLTAKPNDRSRFAGWADYRPCEETTGPCTVLMGQSRVLGAVFKLK